LNGIIYTGHTDVILFPLILMSSWQQSCQWTDNMMLQH